uniref:Putative secreted protein n=1 Tax=Anopheles darlingi TaxID=43151 RepID=A0A2M4DRE0_ANODA
MTLCCTAGTATICLCRCTSHTDLDLDLGSLGCLGEMRGSTILFRLLQDCLEDTIFTQIACEELRFGAHQVFD